MTYIVVNYPETVYNIFTNSWCGEVVNTAKILALLLRPGSIHASLPSCPTYLI